MLEKEKLPTLAIWENSLFKNLGFQLLLNIRQSHHSRVEVLEDISAFGIQRRHTHTGHELFQFTNPSLLYMDGLLYF